MNTSFPPHSVDLKISKMKTGTNLLEKKQTNPICGPIQFKPVLFKDQVYIYFVY